MPAYKRPPESAPLEERIEAAAGHYDGLPCPGCIDAERYLRNYLKLIQDLRAMGVDIEEAERARDAAEL